jgi:Cu-Zn family superoxide dismutase
MQPLQFLKLCCSATLILTATSLPSIAQTAFALRNADGKDVGSVTLTQSSAGVLLTLSIKGLPVGEHAFHIHSVGKCEPPFTSAGGHFNPGHSQHGMLSMEGQHAGDMPNLHIPSTGDLTVEVLNTAVTMEKGKANSIFDADGSAIVIHANKDDYTTDPTGNAGDRVACAVIQ